MKCQKIGGRRYLCLAKFTLSSEYKWGKVRLYVVRVRLGSLKIMWVRLFSTNIKRQGKNRRIMQFDIRFFSDPNEVQFGAKRSLDF